MITISVLGLDQFVVGHYSKDNTKNLAELFECDSSEINFYAPNSMIFHEGVEQTSWHCNVIVYADDKYRPFEGDVAQYLIRTLKEFIINFEIHFVYYPHGSTYYLFNDDYPKYITFENSVATSVAEEEEYQAYLNDENYDEFGDDEMPDIELPSEDELYLGNVFEGFEEKYNNRNK